MSVFQVRVSITEDGQPLPGLPQTARLEDTTSEAKLIDDQYDATSTQEPFGLGSSISPILALRFEGAATVELTSPEAALYSWKLGPDSCIVIMAARPIAFHPIKATHVRGLA